MREGDGRMGRQTPTDRHTHRRTDGRTDKQTDRRLDGRSDAWLTHRLTNERKDKQGSDVVNIIDINIEPV